MSKPLVLLVEESGPVRAVLTVMLASLGYEPLTFGSGAAALRAVRAWRGEAIAAVVDVLMQGMDGMATVLALRALDPGLPCLLLTGGLAPPADRVSGCGAAGALFKPVDPEQLGTALAAVARTVRRINRYA